MPPNHDAGYKTLFSCPELVRDLIMGFIPDPWLHSLDYRTLEKQPNSYVTEDYRSREDDVVWRVRADGEWVYLYLLIEFQSTVDAFMAVRMMVYVGLLYQDLIKRGEVLPGRKLPPVLPIVLYNGEQQWTAAIDMAELVPAVPGLVAEYLPRLKYLKIAANEQSPQHLAALRNLAAVVMQLEQPPGPETVVEMLDLLNGMLEGQPELKKVFAGWIRMVLQRDHKHRWPVEKIRELRELKMGLTERIDMWEEQIRQKALTQGMEKGIQEGIQKGMQKGRQEGRQEGQLLAMRATLRKLLSKRFGALPAGVDARIDTAAAEQLDSWLLEVLSAENINEVFH